MSDQAACNTDLFPQYQCHKKVRAVKIERIDDAPADAPAGFSAAIVPADNLPGFFVTAEFMTKHKPEVGGYWVLYEDGYTSYSPAAAFESGYTLLGAR